jgi:hypothetical protein
LVAIAVKEREKKRGKANVKKVNFAPRALNLIILTVSKSHNLSIKPGPASSVVERSLRKIPSSEGTAVGSPLQDDFSIAII